MVRNPHDALRSVNPNYPARGAWTNQKTWIEAAVAAHNAKNHPRLLIVRYEEFVSEPDKVQEDIAAFTGWEIVRKFSEGPAMWPEATIENVIGMHGKRPLDTNSVTDTKIELTDQCLQWSKEWGYD